MDGQQQQIQIGLDDFTVSREDVELAFKFFSGDGQKISRDDLRLKMEKYFPNLSLQNYKLLIVKDRHEDMSMNDIMKLLHLPTYTRDPVSVKSIEPISHFTAEDAFKVFSFKSYLETRSLILTQMVTCLIRH